MVVCTTGDFNTKQNYAYIDHTTTTLSRILTYQYDLSSMRSHLNKYNILTNSYLTVDNIRNIYNTTLTAKKRLQFFYNKNKNTLNKFSFI